MKSDDKTCELSFISVMRRSKPKAVRPLSESVDYNLNLVEKLEAPALNRVLSIGAEERFKRSSMRLVAYNCKNHKAAASNNSTFLIHFSHIYSCYPIIANPNGQTEKLAINGSAIIG